MTLISFAFVIFDIKSIDSKKAGFVYLLMTHIGSAFLLLTFLIFAKYTGSFSFSSFDGVSNLMPDSLKAILFLFILLGFGTKAGIIPLHIWLPEAHPAAPSHISALMSGVMIKTGIYGILRFIFDFLSPFPSWWGIIVVFIGIITAVLGIIFASSEVDIKRILAYSSIENIGVILLSIGASMIFYSFDQKVLATISLVAALFHSLNHSIFKGLLFTCTGSIVSSTHTRNIEKLGGLIKLMPKTAFLFLIGSLAISALPPFNGFISKWLTFQSVLLLFQIKSEILKLISPIYASLLGFVGAICIATFVKTFSGIFLGMPRSHQAIHAQEATPSMILSMSILAFSCLVIGVFPNIVFLLIKTVTFSIIGLDATSIITFDSLFNSNNFSIKLGSNNFATLSPALVFVLLLIILCLVYIAFNNLGSKVPIRKDETWSCGVKPKPEFGHTPKGFLQPLRVIFSELHTPESFYHDYIYLPIVNSLVNLSHKIRPLQSGVLQIYLLYIFLALVFCLIWLRL
ncbi:MAG: hydrogenase 4 subunit B [Candidatus Melainabacteria bacterium]|nr:hydrogenase 4 subunit B [Candidatus Melainabacteria bacterium]